MSSHDAQIVRIQNLKASLSSTRGLSFALHEQLQMPADQVLITQAQIEKRIHEIASELQSALSDAPLHVVMVLKSALFFGVDLIRALNREATLGFVTASSYSQGTETTGEVQLDFRYLGDSTGRALLLVDDILDTGHTLTAIKKSLSAQPIRELRTCVFLDKPSRREVPFEADHVGFTIEDHFVVGYGLDFMETYRTLPEIRIYRPETN